jgi:hypothetical protein
VPASKAISSTVVASNIITLFMVLPSLVVGTTQPRLVKIYLSSPTFAPPVIVDTLRSKKLRPCFNVSTPPDIEVRDCGRRRVIADAFDANVAARL